MSSRQAMQQKLPGGEVQPKGGRKRTGGKKDDTEGASAAGAAKGEAEPPRTPLRGKECG